MSLSNVIRLFTRGKGRVVDMPIQNSPRTARSIGVLDIILYSESTTGSPWLGPRKNFQASSSETAGKRYFKCDFYKSEMHFVNLLNKIYRRRVRYSFVSRVHYKASAKRLDFSLDFSLYKNLVKDLVV